MLEFIVYCFRCVVGAISWGFGDRPDGMSFQDALVGCIIMIAFVGAVLLVKLIVRIIKRHK